MSGDTKISARKPRRVTSTVVMERGDVIRNQDNDKIVEKSSVQLPQREPLWYWLSFVSILIVGAALRFWNLGARPLHHDESLHAYYSMQLMHNMENWHACFVGTISCYHYDPLMHGPFQFHIIALVYKISQLLGVPDSGINTTTVRIAAATLGTIILALPYFLRRYSGRTGSLIVSALMAVSPSMVYYARFAREDTYMACFTLLLIVAAGCYVSTRKARWLIIAAVAFMLSYATKEATFLSIAVFGSFFVALLAWEIGTAIPLNANGSKKRGVSCFRTKTAALPALGILALICAPLIAVFFSWMKNLSLYISTNPIASNAFVEHLKSQTVSLLPWVGILFCLYVLAHLLWDVFHKKSSTKRTGLAAHVDPKRQPLLDTVVTTPWRHWFFAITAAATIFVIFFSVLFTYTAKGIGDGIWQGVYYWLEQQQVARGGQPWYYYLLLIPLYEQVGLVFGIVGMIRCVWKPSRFRLFLLYWFFGNLAIYSWAGEKMPWLAIHLCIPLCILASLGLEPFVVRVGALVKNGQRGTKRAIYQVQSSKRRTKRTEYQVQLLQRRLANGTAIFGVIIALLLLIPTLQNMFQVSFVHAADAPHEMLEYVQTTADVNIVMHKVDVLDQRFTGGKHRVSIGVTGDGEWPFSWYLRDYTNVCYGFPTVCPSTVPDVIITGGDNLSVYQTQYSLYTIKGKRPTAYRFHRYHLRSWWDEGYKPSVCVPSATRSCQGEPTWGGVGLGPWLSYGDTPPANADLDPVLAVENIWQWWWWRKPFGSTLGSTDMGFFVRDDLGVNP